MRVCVCLVYVCICVYACVCMCVYTCMCLLERVCDCLCVCKHECVCLHEWVCVFAWVSAHLWVMVSVYVCVCEMPGSHVCGSGPDQGSEVLRIRPQTSSARQGLSHNSRTSHCMFEVMKSENEIHVYYFFISSHWPFWFVWVPNSYRMSPRNVCIVMDCLMATWPCLCLDLIQSSAVPKPPSVLRNRCNFTVHIQQPQHVCLAGCVSGCKSACLSICFSVSF